MIILYFLPLFDDRIFAFRRQTNYKDTSNVEFITKFPYYHRHVLFKEKIGKATARLQRAR